MSRVVDLVDRIVVEANAHVGFSQSFTAVKKFIIRPDLGGQDAYRVYVMPGEVDDKIYTRGASEINYTVPLVVMALNGESNEAGTEAALDLVQEIAAFFKRTRYTINGVDYAYLGYVNAPLYAIDAYEQGNTFVATVNLRYKAIVQE